MERSPLATSGRYVRVGRGGAGNHRSSVSSSSPSAASTENLRKLSIASTETAVSAAPRRSSSVGIGGYGNQFRGLSEEQYLGRHYAQHQYKKRERFHTGVGGVGNIVTRAENTSEDGFDMTKRVIGEKMKSLMEYFGRS